MRFGLAALAILVVVGALATACKKPPEAPKGPLDPAKYAGYLTRYPFGGHRVDWWEARLTELEPGGAHADPALYNLTVERAQQNGLVVTSQNGRTLVMPNAQLATLIINRLGVK